MRRPGCSGARGFANLPRSAIPIRSRDRETPMRALALRRAAAAFVLLAAAQPAAAQRARAGGGYVPGAGEDWQRRPPALAGMDSARLQAAAAFHREHESRLP